VLLSRHPSRPYTLDYISRLFTDFTELHGDRRFADDPAIVGGFAHLDGQSVLVLGHQKGRSTKENVLRNFGMPKPEGYRKALRLMELAGRFGRPIICFVDTSGAYPGIDAEERGQAEAIAKNLEVMAHLPVPILCAVIGEGGSGGALALGVADRIFMLENSVYSVISPEGCASILWRDDTQKPLAAEVMKITAADLKRLKIIDEVVPEARGGAHRDWDVTADNLKAVFHRSLKDLMRLDVATLREERYRKFRQMGQFVEATDEDNEPEDRLMSKRPESPGAEEILGLYFPVLDHGFVSLVDYMGTDEDIERAARVSYGYGTRKKNLTRGLIRYLRRHKHTTPSEMVELKFHCCMPIFIARQWIRHRTANVNEYSGRYSLVPTLFYSPEASQLQTQSRANNQGRSGLAVEAALYTEASRRWSNIRRDAAQTYEWLTEQDVARELARIDLPLSTYTQWYWKIDLHNLLHFLTLRVDEHAQWEIQQYGRMMAGMLKRVAPLSYEAWIDYDVCGTHMSRMELDVLRRLVHSEGNGLTSREGRCPRNN
jgi:acetyl-CoA carboxylase carboxyl transferase subunit alpha